MDFCRLLSTFSSRGTTACQLPTCVQELLTRHCCDVCVSVTVCIHDLIIYTLKISILNPIKFSLFQRLSIINNNNQTEVVTTPWRLIGPLIILSAQKCQDLYKHNYLCQKIVSREIEATFIQINTSLLLAYSLSDNLTLISSNYQTTITHSNIKIMHRGTRLIKGNDLQIREHTLNKNFGEI